MPEATKPDWADLVGEHLAGWPPCGQDVVAELAAHLEEVYEAARDGGSSHTKAMRLALEQVDDWQVLAARIARTKSQEDSMNHATNHRSKSVLLPTIVILFGVGMLLLFLDRAAILQRLIWIACMALLLWAGASEASRLNLRTRSLWLPGLVSLIAASLFLFAEELVLTHDSSFYFTGSSLPPGHLVPGLRWFYILWLLAQVLCGALGAFLSRRAGGNRISRVMAGAFPALVMFLLCAFVIPISAFFFEHNTFAISHPSGLALGVLIWAALPAIALLLGAAPFLKDATLEHA